VIQAFCEVVDTEHLQMVVVLVHEEAHEVELVVEKMSADKHSESHWGCVPAVEVLDQG